MRDQSTVSENVPAIDLSHIDENTVLSPEDLNRIVTAIMNPSTEIIDPTFATGQNTKTSLSLCRKMESQTKSDFTDAMQDQLDTIQALTNASIIAEAWNKSTEPDKDSLAYAMVIKQFRDVEKTKLRVTDKHGDSMKEFGAAVRTMIRLGNGLLADQEEHGASIKTGKPGLKYAFTCKAIDGQWKALRGDFMKMRKLSRAVQKLKEFEEKEKVTFVDADNGNEVVTGLSFAELSKEIADLAAMEEE